MDGRDMCIASPLVDANALWLLWPNGEAFIELASAVLREKEEQRV